MRISIEMAERLSEMLRQRVPGHREGDVVVVIPDDEWRSAFEAMGYEVLEDGSVPELGPWRKEDR